MTEFCPCLDVVGRVTSDLDEEGDQRATEIIWGAIARVLLITEQFLQEWPGFYKMVRKFSSLTSLSSYRKFFLSSCFLSSLSQPLILLYPSFFPFRVNLLCPVQSESPFPQHPKWVIILNNLQVPYCHTLGIPSIEILTCNFLHEDALSTTPS